MIEASQKELSEAGFVSRFVLPSCAVPLCWTGFVFPHRDSLDSFV